MWYSVLLPHAGEVLHGSEVGIHKAVNTVGQAALLALVKRTRLDGARRDAFLPADTRKLVRFYPWGQKR